MEATEVTLRDGSQVSVRPIRATDKAALHAGFERLSAESRYRRFLTPMPELTQDALSYLTEVDHHDHEALLALDSQGNGVGVARFVRHDDPDAAEAAVTVIDDWQGRGLGTALLDLLADRARDEGVHRFTALVLAENTEMLDLMSRLSPVHVIDRAPGTVEVEATLPGRGLGYHLRELLRRVARGELQTHSPLWSRDGTHPAAQ